MNRSRGKLRARASGVRPYWRRRRPPARRTYSDVRACGPVHRRSGGQAFVCGAPVPGSERSVDITWEEGEIGPGPYAAVLIRASNAAGDSIFTIAWSDTVCWKCTY